MKGMSEETTISKTYYSDDLNDEVWKDVGDVVVEGGEASVRTEPTDPTKKFSILIRRLSPKSHLRVVAVLYSGEQILPALVGPPHTF